MSFTSSQDGKRTVAGGRVSPAPPTTSPSSDWEGTRGKPTTLVNTPTILHMNDDERDAEIVYPSVWTNVPNGKVEWTVTDGDFWKEVTAEDEIPEPEGWPLAFGFWVFVIAFLCFLTLLIALG